ncbi:hypothetical protein [Bosea sp. 124]|uniref:hypothetical protein n=1 Tax=Bosea sp. 124 TaxID=2135642 RepID=UPI000D3363BC|nr:hypothetical protein [Bosea sp. 124]
MIPALIFGDYILDAPEQESRGNLAAKARIAVLAASLLDAAGEEELFQLQQAAKLWGTRLELA